MVDPSPPDPDSRGRPRLRHATPLREDELRWARTAVNLVRSTPLLVSSVANMLTEDPVLFAVQAARRAPHGARDVLTRLPLPGRAGSPTRVFWLFMLDRRTQVAEELDGAPAPTSRAGRRLTDTIRLRLGMSVDPASATPAALARQIWEQGDVTRAVEIAAPDPALHARLASERAVLTPGRTLLLPRTPATGNPRTASGNAQAATGAPSSIGAQGATRVLHVLTNSLPWTNSGYALRSHAVLRAQREAGLDVSAVTRLAYPVTIGRPWADRVEGVDGLTYRRLLPASQPRTVEGRLALQARMTAELARQVRPDVIHTTTNFHNALVARALSRAIGVPWVYEMRGELEKSWVARHPRAQQDQALGSERYALMRARETELARDADAVVVLSQVQREAMIARGVAPERIHVVPNAVEDRFLDIPRDPRGARERLGLDRSGGGFWAGSVSAMVDYEGFDTLLRAVALLVDRGLDVRCVLVGDGVARPELADLADRLGIAERAVLPGRVTPEDAQDWYQALDVMVIPRRDTPVTRAVTPIKGLQAMAMGIPLVVSDLPALTEIGSADGQGLTVPAEDPVALADALARLAADTELATRLSDAARTAARTRTWSANGQAYAQMYQDLLSS